MPRASALGHRVEQLVGGHGAGRRHPQVELHVSLPVPAARRRRSRRRPAGPGWGRARRPAPTGRRRSAGRPASRPGRCPGRAGRRPMAMPAISMSSSRRMMSSPIHMSAPPTAAEPAAFVGGLGGHGQAEEGRALVDALEQAEDQAAAAVRRGGVVLERPRRWCPSSGRTWTARRLCSSSSRLAK